MQQHSLLSAHARISLALALLVSTGCPKDDPIASSDTATTTAAGTTSAGETVEPTTTETTTEQTTSATETTGEDPPVCGDGVVDEGEACDDGNDDDDDGCTAACALEVGIKWTRSFDGGRGGFDLATDVAIDSAGNVYVVGIQEQAGGDRDQLVLALDPEGEIIWQKTFAGEGGELDFLNAVVVGDDGSIFVSGGEHPSAGTSAAVIRKLDPDGEPLWSYSDPSPSGLFTTVEALVLAGDSIVGVGAEELGDNVHCPVHSLDAASGAVLWEVAVDVGGGFTSCISVTATDATLIAVGLGWDDEEGSNRELDARLSLADGSVQSITLGEPGYVGHDLVVHPNMEETLVGRVDGADSRDFVIRRRDPEGSELWNLTLGTPQLDDTGRAVERLDDGGVLVAGSIAKLGELSNAFVARYDAQGAEVWRSTYNNAELSLSDDAQGLALGPGFAVAAGSEQVLGEGYNVWVRAFYVP